jgi:signal transduction histidine kinase/CheY-like chemotaxis protein
VIDWLRRFFRPIPSAELPDLSPALTAGVRLPCAIIVAIGPLVSLAQVATGEYDLPAVIATNAIGQPLFWGLFALTCTGFGRRRPELVMLGLLTLVNLFTRFTGLQNPQGESPLSVLTLVTPLTIAAFAPWRPTFSILSGASAIGAWALGSWLSPERAPIPISLAGLLVCASAAVAACACQSQRLVWAELYRARREANAGVQAKSEFLAAMSHEIRTPMTAILGYTDELVQGAERGATAPLATLDTIRRNGERLLALLDGILDLVRVESGRVELTVEPCSPAAIVSAVTERLAMSAATKGLRLEVELGAALPREVLADGARLRQILHALVENAIKFTEHGEVRVGVRREPDASGEDEHLVFDVLDTGIGLAPDVLRRLFVPFSRADASMGRRFGGAGIGLALAQRLARMQGGAIEASPREGGGSVFRLRVPLRVRVTAPPPHPGARSLCGRVLLADDGPDNRALIARILQRAGMQVELAENGREAHAKAMSALLSGAPFDVVLMDMQMPEMSGEDAVRALRADGYDAPIVALTAQALGGDRSSCLAAGCDDYAAKPIDRETLLDLVARFLEKRTEG